jgi:hypothetical protein
MNDIVQPVKITISGRLSFEEEITLGQAAQIIGFISSSDPGMGMPTPVLPLATPPPSAPKMISALSIGTMLSPREALNASGAKTNAEKIVAFALCIAQEGDKDTFTIEDIKPLFRRARETAPTNMSRDLAMAIKAGWVADSDMKNEYYVAAKATGVLETGFKGIRQARGNGTKVRSSNGKPSRKAINTVPEAFKHVDTIESTIEGCVSYHKLTKKVDKFLWAVYAAKLLGASSVSNQDIVWLTDRLGDAIPTGNITKNVQHLSKAGYVNRSLQDSGIRVTPKGEEYLKSLEP